MPFKDHVLDVVDDDPIAVAVAVAVATAAAGGGPPPPPPPPSSGLAEPEEIDSDPTSAVLRVALIGPRPDITLLPHQEKGVTWMMAREHENAPLCRGGILADDMGLGKTFQTIALLKNSPYALTTLILCPPALLSGWTKELKDCGYPVYTLDRYKTDGICVATYNHAHLHAGAYRAANFGRVILDEGHIIRNGKATKRWWTCKALSKKSACRWILSATPVQNGLSDWTNLCIWLHVKSGPSTYSGLASTIMLRRTMEDLRSDAVMAESLPPPPVFVRHALLIPEETEEGKFFRSMADQLNSLVNSKISALIKLEFYMRVQQFLVHPQMYIEAMRNKYKGAYPRPDWTGTATKYTAFSEELAASKEPTVVFCHFRAEMDMVEALCLSLGRSVWSIRGGIGSDGIGRAVQEAKEASRTESSGVVVIVQIVAGGAGLNLQFCSRILFLSQHWNPAVVHQACGRCVRIGQRGIVKVHLFSIVDEVADNIDRRMLELHLTKIAAAKGICESLYQGGAWE